MIKKITTHAFLFVLFFLISYFYFLDSYSPSGAIAYLQGKFTSTDPADVSNEPKTESCPLNGKMYDKTQKELWEKRRPLGIMVENSVDARPQSGLSNADVVFEAVAEGGITRFLSIFYCQDQAVIGPVRSARVYFLDFVSGFGNSPLYAHVGGANTPGPADALGQIEDEGWAGYNDLNQFSIGFPVFWRDYEKLSGVAPEHTMYTNSEKLWQIGQDRGLTNQDKKGKSWDKNYQDWDFKDDVALANRPKEQQIKFGFWEKYHDFDVVWTYNQNNNNYVRNNGGKPHIDNNTNKALSTKNVVILFMDESVANDGYEGGQHLLYKTTGEGRAIVFNNGEATKATWSKEDRYSQVYLLDQASKPIKFVKGEIWFEVIPSDNKVSY